MINWSFEFIILLASSGLDLVLLVVSFFLKKSKPSLKGVDLFEKIPEFIRYAEDVIGSGNGQRKLGLVLSLVKSFILESGCRVEDFDFQEIRTFIENILSSPQSSESKKKGVEF